MEKRETCIDGKESVPACASAALRNTAGGMRQERQQRFFSDSFGFEQLLDFFPEDNPLRTAEMGLEDDYNMIDGIINNGPRQEKEQLPVPDLKLDELRHRQHKHRSEPER